MVEPFPGSGNLTEVAALATKLIRFDYLATIYIQELCEVLPIKGVPGKEKGCEEREVKIKVKMYCVLFFNISELFKLRAECIGCLERSDK